MVRKGDCLNLVRKSKPDIVYNSNVISYFINMVMKDGKKTIATRIVYNSLDLVKEKLGIDDSFFIFKKAVNNIRPVVEVRSKRVGGATYQVPVEVNIKRSTTLALRWLIFFSKKRAGKNMVEKLCSEIMDASDDTVSIGNSKGKGGAIKKREDTHRMAEANKAFSHYRW
jgi:small subunit ribosomal protein S7